MSLARLALTFAVIAVLGAMPAAIMAAEWPTDPKLSGNAFLPPGLITLQNDTSSSPITLYLDRGRTLWMDASQGKSCADCHGPLTSMKTTAGSFPRLSAGSGKLINLEDQIITCRSRAGLAGDKLESEPVLALSAALHATVQGQSIQVQTSPTQASIWQEHLQAGAKLYATRVGRMNLACTHCHDQNIGRQMRADVISPANPTGFPIYRMSWQGIGSIDRRLRACFSGVQAVMPPAGDQTLRQLELYLKVRAQGLTVDGPSIRR
jgi:sulfur-oxidizing protein SoxA